MHDLELATEISFLVNCYLVALCNAGDVKTYFEFDHMLQLLVDDIKDSKKDGLSISTDVFEGTVKIGIAQVMVDNLVLMGFEDLLKAS